MTFATLQDVKNALRMMEGEDEDDALLETLLAAATKAVTRYLKSSAQPFLEPEAVIPDDVRVATVMLTAFLYRAPDNDREDDFERGFLPRPVTALLYPLRDPTVA